MVSSADCAMVNKPLHAMEALLSSEDSPFPLESMIRVELRDEHSIES